MGAKSTTTMGREEAIVVIRLLLETATDEGVANALESLNDDHYERGLDSLGLQNFGVTRGTVDVRGQAVG